MKSPRMLRVGVCAIFFITAYSADCQVVINELMSANSSTIVDPEFGESADWIELYNTALSDMDLGGYFLTDNISDTTKWTFPPNTILPANGFLLIWADGLNTGLHTSFKLSSAGEELGLYDPSESLLDSLTFPSLLTNISFGRGMDGDDNWFWFSESTPGTTNSATTAYLGITYYQPFFSLKGGFFNDPQSVQLSSLGGTIRYTLDGRSPTPIDPIYNGEINFNLTTFIRARVFMDGYIPGPIITHSYFFDSTFVDRGLPVVSLVTDPDFFWDPEIGIYVQDFKPEWEQPLNIEFFENDGNNQSVFNQQAGVKINGLWSWQLPQKMLGIYFRNEYGAGNLDYPIFPDRDRATFDEFMLRASGSDWSYTLFRDGLCQSLTQQNAPVHDQGFRQCIVFINGEYMGIHNMRSRANGEELEQSYGVEPGSYDIINNDGEIEEGSDAQFLFMDSLFNTDLTDPDNYLLLSNEVDLVNFTDYWITEIWSSNSSWGHNVKMWKSHDTGKWQFLFGDLDRGFTGGTDDPISEFSVPQGGSDYDYARYWLEHIFENQDYANYFAQRFNDHIYTTFHPVRVNNVIEKFQSPLLPEIQYHVDRWSGTTSNYGDGIPTVQFWEDEVEVLRQFAVTRQSFMMSDLQNTFGLNTIVSLGTSSLPNNGGRIRLNEFMIPGSPWSGPYFTGMPLQLIAIPNPGYAFEGWSEYQLLPVFELGGSWNYLDDGTDQGVSWNQPGFDDSAWATGNGEFGYGDGDETTVINYGPNAGDKYITTYFRKEFEFTGDDSFPVSCIINVRRDDGIVLYHNGIEILRSNMPAGEINYLTTATEAIGGTGESALNEFLIELPLVTGTNILTAEIHQVNGQSSDISFDASLSIITPSEIIISTDSVLTVTLSENTGYIARYVPTGACILPSEITADTTLSIDCSPYLASGDTYVFPGVSLTVEPGVEIWFPEGARLIVQGDLQVNGTAEQEVLFKANNDYGAQSWGNMSFENSTALNHLNYLELREATTGEHPIHNRAAISAWFSDIEMDHVTLTQNFDNPIFGEYSSFTLTNSLVHSPVTGDLINVKYGEGYISDCVFLGNDQPDTDAIDYDDVTDGVIRNSVIQGFYGFNSDAIDLGEECVNILVENCLVNDCTDKGISIGQSSSALVLNNTIVNCNLGLGIKDLGHATVDHLTLYSNVFGIECFEKNPGLGGGFADVTNSIISNSSSSPISVDVLSNLNTTYCFYDTDTMPGNTNMWMNPLFVNPTNYDFHLQSLSPAVAAGNDGEDLGTLDHSFGALPKIVISDIQYFHPDTADREFLRIYNPGAETLDLGNYVVSEAIDFIFPEGTMIEPGEKIMLVKDITLLPIDTGQIFQWTNGQLENNGEMLLLSDPHGIIIDHVWYDDEAPWPQVSLADQYIKLISPMLDNHFASSWQLSPAPVEITEFDEFNYMVYPNPATTQLLFVSSELIQHIDIYDGSGKLMLQNTSSSSFVSLDVQKLEPGIFVAIINQLHQVRFVIDQ